MSRQTGIVRSLDNVGRLVIPKDLRDKYNLSDLDSIEILTTDEGILLKKYQPSCAFCKGFKDLKVLHGIKICSECRTAIVEGNM